MTTIRQILAGKPDVYTSVRGDRARRLRPLEEKNVGAPPVVGPSLRGIFAEPTPRGGGPQRALSRRRRARS